MIDNNLLNMFANVLDDITKKHDKKYNEHYIEDDGTCICGKKLDKCKDAYEHMTGGV